MSRLPSITEDNTLFYDNDIIVIDKPSGLLSVPGREIKESAVSHLQDGFGEIHVVHRLDRDTSGVMVFARNKSSLVSLQQQFEKRSTHKIYEALVHGHHLSKQGVINLPLLVDWPNRPRQAVNFSEGKYGLTRWQLRGRERLELHDNLINVSRVDLLPKTGRSHQLRVHCQQLNSPIVGDSLYSDYLNTDSKPFPRLCLHSRELGFRHPANEQLMQFYKQPSF